MVFEVEFVTGELGDHLARAEADAIREICVWVAQRRAASASGAAAMCDEADRATRDERLGQARVPSVESEF
ncbi:hypothetical protein [Frankia sp. AgB1.8]|uniref:hypothetical protein n=1 Tax=Frankia sp. AgB1.8 TaxID=2792839 RepID=UPI001931C280|nr:hypothetical protein [Frankia sp. AgB1.8]